MQQTWHFDDNSYAQWATEPAPAEDLRDEAGRLLDPRKVEEANHAIPEDLELYVSCWKEQRLAAQVEWEFSSRFVFPDVNYVVCMHRMDVYECASPRTQQATLNMAESLRIRSTPGWFPVRSIFFLNAPTTYTKEICIESAAPPRRHRFRPFDKNNPRDLANWVLKEKFNGYIGAERIPGAQDFFVDFTDSPDRYFISSTEEPTMGYRRIYRFAGYPVTQYYILEKRVHHECLESEGGSGLTYIIESGPELFAAKGWRIIGSFYGLDREMLCTNHYHIYRRDDPFPRMQIAMGPIDDAEGWQYQTSFYAWDIPVGGTCNYTLYHCCRSIHSMAATVVRHRLAIGDTLKPWDFRLGMYVFPASLADCTFTANS